MLKLLTINKLKMKICPVCKVELDEEITRCPLCNSIYSEHGANLSEMKGESDDIEKEDDFIFVYKSLTKSQKIKLFWEVSAIILFSGILITTIIDIVTTGGFSWSRYTITVCLILFSHITLFVFQRNRPIIILISSLFTLTLLIILFDYFGINSGWGIGLAIPLLLTFFGGLTLLIIAFRKARTKGFNLLATIFIIIGLLSLMTEGIISRYYNSEIELHWSPIVLVSMITIAGILFYIHYRLKKNMDLSRFFHI